MSSNILLESDPLRVMSEFRRGERKDLTSTTWVSVESLATFCVQLQTDWSSDRSNDWRSRGRQESREELKGSNEKKITLVDIRTE